MCTTLYITKERKNPRLSTDSNFKSCSSLWRQTAHRSTALMDLPLPIGTTGLKEAEQPYSGREWAPVATAL